nr:ABC transporter substrate-binding protein [Simiduia aestuariiviva]
MQCTVSCFAAERLVLAADVWCPYNCQANHRERPGYMIELAQRVFSEHGIEVQYVNLPWSRAKASVSEGLAQGLVGATLDDPDTRHLVFPDHAQGQMHNVFVGRKGENWRYQGLSSLRTVRIGAIQDYEYGPTLDNYMAIPNVPVHTVSGDRPLTRLIRMLQSRRIDVIVEDHSVFRYTASSLEFTDFELLGDIPGPTALTNLYIAFTPDPQGRRYAELLSNGVAALRARGELAEIMAKYELIDWMQPLTKSSNSHD